MTLIRRPRRGRQQQGTGRRALNQPTCRAALPCTVLHLRTRVCLWNLAFPPPPRAETADRAATSPGALAHLRIH